MTTSPVIRVSNIRKVYGSTVAVDDVSFDVERGEIFGVIGPNGAGKTTTMECVAGLRKADRGTIAVLGFDPVRDLRALQQKVGVQLQQAQLQKRIKVSEAVALWASLYRNPADGNRLIEQLGLSDKRNAWFMTLSGGQKQRLFIALAVIHDPDVVLITPLIDLGSDQADYVKACRQLRIPVGHCVASWDNLTNKGLIKALPDRVFEIGRAHV